MRYYYLVFIDFYSDYGKWSKTEEGFRQFVQDYIMNVENHDGYVKKLGKGRLKKIAAERKK